MSKREDYIIGTSSIHSDLFLSTADENYVVPFARDANYSDKILKTSLQTKPDFLHIQNDNEVQIISNLRDDVKEIGVTLFLPSKQTIDNCINKMKSYNIWKSAGLRVPTSMILNNEEDLKKAFDIIGEKIWIRSVKGAAGFGALPTK